MYKLSNLHQVLGVVTQTKISGGYRNHDPHTNSLAHTHLRNLLMAILFIFGVFCFVCDIETGI